jgi:hypothetical protein
MQQFVLAAPCGTPRVALLNLGAHRVVPARQRKVSCSTQQAVCRWLGAGANLPLLVCAASPCRCAREQAYGRAHGALTTYVLVLRGAYGVLGFMAQ